jgi:hypothetical protein
VSDIALYASELADRIDEALPEWVEASVVRVMASAGRPADPEMIVAARAAGQQARREVGAHIRALLEADIDRQHTTPLAILRAEALRYPTEVLRAAGAPAAGRDAVAEAMFPDDTYDLAPATFADLGPDLFEAGIAWGAAKAFEHKKRHGGN